MKEYENKFHRVIDENKRIEGELKEARKSVEIMRS